MGFWSSLGSVLSSIGSAITGALGISSAAGALVTAIVGVLNPVLDVIFVVSTLIQIARSLGIFSPEDNAEELGDKAIQAAEAGITPDKFDTYEEYVQRIRNFELNPERSGEISPEAKLRKGAELGVGLMAERLGTPVLECLGELAQRPTLWEDRSSRIPLLFAELRKQNTSHEALTDYMRGERLDPADQAAVGRAVRAVEHSLNPDDAAMNARKVLNALRLTPEA